MKDQSVWIDGEQIIDRGTFLGPDSLVQAVQELEILYG